MRVLTLYEVYVLAAYGSGTVAKHGEACRDMARQSHCDYAGTYTSTGVRAPWVMEQQTAPARANLEYRAAPLTCGAAGASSLVAIVTDVRILKRQEVEWSGLDARSGLEGQERSQLGLVRGFWGGWQ